MKVVKNGYTRTKLNGVYAENFPILVRTILNGFLFILEKNAISTGEPCYNKDKKLYGFYTSFSTFFYNDKTDEINIYYNKTFSNDWAGKESDNVIIKTYKNIDETCCNDLKDFIKSKRKILSLDEILQKVEKFKEYGEDWNSYRCNPVSEKSVNVLKDFITYLYDKINFDEISFHPHAIADGGNEVRRPDEDSRSTTGIELTNGYRSLEFEISKDGEIIPIAFEHVYDDATYESKGLDWPKEFTEFGDEYVIKQDDFLNDEFLKWSLNWIHYGDIAQRQSKSL